jgi:IS30 family transposase
VIKELRVARRSLSISDRVEISTGRKAGWSVRAIAAAVDRSLSVVSREIRRNSGNASAAATLVERTTRFTIILALPTGKNADGVAEALIDTITAWPADHAYPLP